MEDYILSLFQGWNLKMPYHLCGYLNIISFSPGSLWNMCFMCGAGTGLSGSTLYSQCPVRCIWSYSMWPKPPKENSSFIFQQWVFVEWQMSSGCSLKSPAALAPNKRGSSSFKDFQTKHWLLSSHESPRWYLFPILLLFSCSFMSNSFQLHGWQHAGSPVLYCLPEFAQIHVHCVSDDAL